MRSVLRWKVDEQCKWPLGVPCISGEHKHGRSSCIWHERHGEKGIRGIAGLPLVMHLPPHYKVGCPRHCASLYHECLLARFGAVLKAT